ncbi:hypothetical protein BLOT_016763 [Blomia tropicalis]|nr:hypothetical protein BLOT_016763 [Blomia tropicalis]
MSSSDPPNQARKDDVPHVDIKQHIRDIKTIINADPRTFSKKRAQEVGNHLANIECLFLKLSQDINQLKLQLEAQTKIASSKNSLNTAKSNDTPRSFSAVVAQS